MGILATLQQSIGKVGIKEVARRAGLSPSTVSRIGSGLINPSLEVVEKVSNAIGFHLELLPNKKTISAPRLSFTKDVLRRLRNELKALGVKHAIIFGSVARGEDIATSDIDIFLDFNEDRPSAAKMLKAEGKVIEAFGENKVDLVSNVNSPKGQRLKQQIDKDGIYAF
jgi:predicted nucleotidyltransferase